MDKLPPELLLEIAGYCDFAGVCAISKLNRRWNEVIESNWNSLEKTRVESILLDEEYQLDRRENETIIQCTLWEKGGRRKVTTIKIANGSENVEAGDILENGWIIQENIWKDLNQESRLRPQELSPKDADKFLEDFLTPLFRQSTISEFALISLKSSTLQLVVALLEHYRPAFDWLDMTIGWKDGHLDQLDVQELDHCARIVQLTKPDTLSFRIADPFAQEDVCERFMKRIANQSEWSKSEREIVEYEFEHFTEEITDVAAQFELELRERNLPVRIEVVKQNVEFLIKKIPTRGDDQDELRLNFKCYVDRSGKRYADINSVIMKQEGYKGY